MSWPAQPRGAWPATALGLHWWLPAVLVAPAAVVLLLTARVRRAGAGWLLAGLLPLVVGVALVAVATGRALAGSWALYAGGSALAAVALCTAVLLASPRRLRHRPAES